VPVFCADIKGDVAGLAMAGEPKDFPRQAGRDIGFADEYRFEAFPVVFWDLFGKEGHPVRATISEIGPLLLSRMLDLNDTQEGVLNIAFRIADEDGLLLLDLKDLQAMLVPMSPSARRADGALRQRLEGDRRRVQRKLLVLEEQGGDSSSASRRSTSPVDAHDPDGRGIVNVLAADTLMQSPRLYATFLLWLLSELFENCPRRSAIRRSRGWSSSSTRRTSCSTTRRRRCWRRSSRSSG
jgi:uncharacterized protein